MKVLFVASEMAPFVKTGGLGDVVGALPKALQQKGLDVRVVIPHYSMIGGAEYLYSYWVPRRQGNGEAHVSYTKHGEIPVYFLKSWPYFVDDNQIYTVWDWDSPRFIYFSQMATAFIWELAQGKLDNGEPWWPDVVHVQDWHTGLVPFLLHEARFNAGWNDIASVLTIHNMAFQGPYVGQWLQAEALAERNHPDLPWREWKDNLMAIGMAYSQKVNTVSPQHATELHYPRFGEGLQDLVWRKGADFSGIVNGIDTEIFNPETDRNLVQNYNADNFREKRLANKLALQEAFHLEVNPNIPLIAYVGRLTAQKGVDFAVPALDHILNTERVQFVGLGAGDKALEESFGGLGLKYSHQARTYLGYNFALAQKIYAAADLMLVPSRYEPCGLTQIISMRYGCLPLVRETGGLADTVQNYDNAQGDYGTGFMFLFEEGFALTATLRWALDVYHTKRAVWERMQERAMRIDWSWDKPAQDYIQMYEAAIAQKRAWRKG